jgi:hypothetical protein
VGLTALVRSNAFFSITIHLQYCSALFLAGCFAAAAGGCSPYRMKETSSRPASAPVRQLILGHEENSQFH